MNYQYRILYAFLLLSLSTQAQNATDITPNKGGYTYLNPTTDNKGNLYVIRSKDYRNHRIMVYRDSTWTDITADFSGQPSSLFTTGNNLYAIGSSWTMNYRLNHWNGKGWDTISLGSTNGYIRDVSKLPNGQLVVKGVFDGDKGKHYLATLKDSTWVPYDSYEDDSTIRHALEKYLSKGIAADSKGNIYSYCWETGASSNHENVVFMFDGTRWKKIFSRTRDRISSIEVTSNGTVYAGGDFRKGSGPTYFMKWDGTKWNEIFCKQDGYDCNWMDALTMNEAGEPLLAGKNKSGNGYAVLQYANENWHEFASLTTGPIEIMTYNKAILYAVTNNYSSIWKIPKGNKGKGTPVVIAPSKPKDEQAKEVYAIFQLVSNKFYPILSNFTESYMNIENATTNKDLRFYAKSITQRSPNLISITNAYITSLRNLNIARGNNELADVLMVHLNQIYSMIRSMDDIATALVYVTGTPAPSKEQLLSNKREKTEAVRQSTEKIKNLLPDYKLRNEIYYE